MLPPAIHVGDVTVHPLLDATVDYPWPLGELFPGVPTTAWEPYRERYPETFGAGATWRSRSHCYLLVTRDRTVLLDAGMGPAHAPMAQALHHPGELLDRFAEIGIAPVRVDTVLLSHLHPDHVGGTVDADGAPCFPQARYVVPAADWEAFHRPEVQGHLPFSFVAETLDPLAAHGVLDVVSAPRRVSDEITVLPAPGHTPGHAVVDVRSRGERALLLVDAFLHPAQITEPEWMSMFDMDAAQTRQARLELLEQLEAQDTLVALSHFPAPTFGHVRRVDGRRWWVPE